MNTDSVVPEKTLRSQALVKFVRMGSLDCEISDA